MAKSLIIYDHKYRFEESLLSIELACKNINQIINSDEKQYITSKLLYTILQQLIELQSTSLSLRGCKIDHQHLLKEDQKYSYLKNHLNKHFNNDMIPEPYAMGVEELNQLSKKLFSLDTVPSKKSSNFISLPTGLALLAIL